jgi:hypothetical protein
VCYKRPICEFYSSRTFFLEQAVFTLYKLYNLFPVSEDVCYDNKDEERKHTKRSKQGQAKVKTDVSVQAIIEERTKSIEDDNIEDEKVTAVRTVEDDPIRKHVKHGKRSKSDVNTKITGSAMLQVSSNKVQSAKRQKGLVMKTMADSKPPLTLRRSNRKTSKETTF